MPKETLEDNAYRLIVHKIVQHRFKPGDYLLETELAHELKLSRTPVRQALGRLIAEGFLEKKPKKGCVIPIPTAEDAEMVRDARCLVEGIDIPLIVGGGIRDAKTAGQKAKAGADIVVTGTKLEEEKNLKKALGDIIKSLEE